MFPGTGYFLESHIHPGRTEPECCDSPLRPNMPLDDVFNHMVEYVAWQAWQDWTARSSHSQILHVGRSLPGCPAGPRE